MPNIFNNKFFIFCGPNVFESDELTLKMTIRSDAGVRLDKKLEKLGQLAKFTQLKLQYSGTV